MGKRMGARDEGGTCGGGNVERRREGSYVISLNPRSRA